MQLEALVVKALYSGPGQAVLKRTFGIISAASAPGAWPFDESKGAPLTLVKEPGVRAGVRRTCRDPWSCSSRLATRSRNRLTWRRVAAASSGKTLRKGYRVRVLGGPAFSLLASNPAQKKICKVCRS